MHLLNYFLESICSSDGVIVFFMQKFILQLTLYTTHSQ